MLQTVVLATVILFIFSSCATAEPDTQDIPQAVVETTEQVQDESTQAAADVTGGESVLSVAEDQDSPARIPADGEIEPVAADTAVDETSPSADELSGDTANEAVIHASEGAETADIGIESSEPSVTVAVETEPTTEDETFTVPEIDWPVYSSSFIQEGRSPAITIARINNSKAVQYLSLVRDDEIPAIRGNRSTPGLIVTGEATMIETSATSASAATLPNQAGLASVSIVKLPSQKDITTGIIPFTNSGSAAAPKIRLQAVPTRTHLIMFSLVGAAILLLVAGLFLLRFLCRRG